MMCVGDEAPRLVLARSRCKLTYVIPARAGNNPSRRRYTCSTKATPLVSGFPEGAAGRCGLGPRRPTVLKDLHHFPGRSVPSPTNAYVRESLFAAAYAASLP